jgi:REP-associated tyrosine transposase
MPRPLREQVADGIYHVFARGNDRRRLYVDVPDRVTYLALLARVVRKKKWRCLAYCLMGNHLHLVLETPEPNLAAGMQVLQSSYARTFNARHGGSGHLFEGRYGAVRIRTDQQLWTAVRYVALNPVEASLAAAPDDYAWSSHGAVLSGAVPSWLDRRRLLAFFAGAGGEPVDRYRRFVDDGVARSMQRGGDS